MAVGAVATITYSVTVHDPGTGDKTMVNPVSSTTVGSDCPPASGNAACRATVVVLTPGLTLVKSADRTTTNLGSTVKFTVTATNSGQVPYAAAVFSDSLVGVTDDATFNAGAITADIGTTDYSGGVLSWSGALNPGQSAVVTYTVTVNSPDLGDHALSNTVVSTSTGSNCAAGSPDTRCTAMVAITNAVSLTFTKTADVPSTAAGGTVRYTVTAVNASTSALSANFTDPLAGIIDDATYNADVTVVGGGSATFSTPNLVWTGTVPAGGTVTMTYTVTVHQPLTGNHILAGTITSTIPAASNNCLSGSSDTRCTSTVPVAALLIVAQASTVTTTPGSVLQLSATFTNTGQVPYVGISISSAGIDLLDDVTPSGDQTATAGSLTITETDIVWTGDIPVGGVVTIDSTATVHSPDTGNKHIYSPWVTAAPGANCPVGGTDDACALSITVQVPGLTINTTSSTPATAPGGAVTFTTTVQNTGESAYAGAVVTTSLTSVLDDATYDGNAAATINGVPSGVVSYLSPTLTWTGDLAVGQTATITYSVSTRSPATGDKIMTNVVSSAAVGSSCPSGSGSAACQITVAVLTPALTIVKTADLANANLGSTVSYTVKVTNSGQTPYPAADFTDELAAVLDDATYNNDADATFGTADYVDDVLSWSGALNPGDFAIITYTVTINDPDTGDMIMTNTITSATAGSNCATGSLDTRCTAIVAVTNAVSVTFTKTADVLTTVDGAVVNYTVTATNSTVATIGDVNFTDPLDGILDDATYNADAAASPGAGVNGALAYTEPDLTWTGDLPAGQTVTVTYSVTVLDPAPGDLILGDVVTSTAPSASNNCLAASGDPRCVSTVPVARLSLTYSPAIEPTTTPGGVVHFVSTYTNTGQVPYQGISVVTFADDAADDGLPGVQTVTSGTLVLNPTGITWFGDIPIGGEITLDALMPIQNPDPGDKYIMARMESSAPGNNCQSGSNDPACIVEIDVLLPQLTITKSANVGAVQPGGAVQYTVLVHNSGETPYTAATVIDNLAGVVDDATYNNNATASQGDLSFSSPTLTWTGDLAVNDTVTINYTVTARNPDPGDKVMASGISSVDAGSSCPPGSGGPGCANTVIVLTPALTFVKTADQTTTTLGGTVSYTITATNTGQTAYLAANSSAAVFADSLAGVADDATYNSNAAASIGDISNVGGVLNWAGDLLPGDSSVITYSVTVNRPDSGNLNLTNSVVSTTSGNNCAAASADPRCTAIVAVTNADSLTFIATSTVSSTVRGSVVGFSVSATNASTAAVASNFTEPLTGILDDATYNGDALAVGGGTATFTDPNLTWVGTVAAGATVTVTFSVTVDMAETGDELLTGTVTSTSPTASNNCLAGSDDSRCTRTVPVSSLLIQQAYTETSTTPGSLVHLSATFINTGQVAFQGITIASPSADTVDDAIPTGDQTATSGTLILSASAISWTGNIPVGGSVTVVGTLTVKKPDPGNKLITGTLATAAVGSNCPTGGTDTRCTAVLPVLLPELTINTSANVTFVVPNGVVVYTVTVENTGETDYVGAVVTDSLAGLLDDAVYNANADSQYGRRVVRQSIPDLDTRPRRRPRSATMTYSVTAKRPATGDKAMVETVSSLDAGSTCLPGNAVAACRSTVVVLSQELTINSTTSALTAAPGQIVTYTVTATNTGQTAYTTATFDASLAGIVDDATYNNDASAGSGTVGLTGQTLTWTGPLAIGVGVSVSYSVTVNDPDAGNHRLEQTLTSIRSGNNCLAGSTDPRCTTSVPIASLVLTTATNVTTTKPTGVVTYTNTFTNTGQVAYVGITILIDVAGAGDDGTYNGDGTATAGTVNIVPGAPTVSWTGDLAVGQTVVFTASLTINNPDLGNHLLTAAMTTTAAGSNCPVGGSSPTCVNLVTVLRPALTITKTADTTDTTPGRRSATPSPSPTVAKPPTPRQ